MKLATLCYVKRDGQTLMLLRNKKPNDYHEGKWNGLGGKLEPGESPEEGMCREILEEAGLTVTEARLRGFITFPNFDGKDDWYVFLYTIHGFTGEVQSCLEGELHWIDDDKVLELNLWPGDRVFLPWLTQERLFSAKFTYEAGAFKKYDVVFYGEELGVRSQNKKTRRFSLLAPVFYPSLRLFDFVLVKKAVEALCEHHVALNL